MTCLFNSLHLETDHQIKQHRDAASKKPTKKRKQARDQKEEKGKRKGKWKGKGQQARDQKPTEVNIDDRPLERAR
jgi:hypothetical protein